MIFKEKTLAFYAINIPYHSCPYLPLLSLLALGSDKLDFLLNLLILTYLTVWCISEHVQHLKIHWLARYCKHLLSHAILDRPIFPPDLMLRNCFLAANCWTLVASTYDMLPLISGTNLDFGLQLLAPTTHCLPTSPYDSILNSFQTCVAQLVF